MNLDNSAIKGEGIRRDIDKIASDTNNDIPHITVALSGDTKAVYSNLMLINPEKIYTCQLKLSDTIKAFK